MELLFGAVPESSSNTIILTLLSSGIDVIQIQGSGGFLIGDMVGVIARAMDLVGK